MSKFWFFERKGRPTTVEKNICDKLTDLIYDGTIAQSELEEYIAQYGKAYTDEDLKEMFSYFTGEDLEGNRISNYEDDDYDDDIEDAVEDIIEDKNIPEKLNANQFYLN